MKCYLCNKESREIICENCEEFLKTKSEDLESKKANRDSIKEIISEIEKCEIESMKLNKILKFENKILNLKKNSENLDYKISKRDELKNSIENFEDLNSKILKQNSIIDSEKIVNKIPWWIWVIVSILLIIVIIIVIREVRN